MDFSDILGVDRALTLLLNGGGRNIFMDNIVLVFTSGYTWIPLYISLLFIVLRNNEKWKQILLIIFSVSLCYAISCGLNLGYIKPLLARPRPFFDTAIASQLHIVNNYKPEGFSFFSAHSCNSFLLATFFAFLVRSKLLNICLFSWAVLTAYSRIYLGVHYVSDVVVGTIIGMMIGAIIYIIYNYIYKKYNQNIVYISTQYTSTGYNMSDIDIVITVYVILCLYCIFYGLMSIKI